MSLYLQASAGLTETHLTQIGRLEQICNQFEGLTMKLNWGTLRRHTMMLTHTVQQLVTDGHKNIVLEVATDNRNALSLYERCGFQVTTAYDYYRLPVKD